MLNRKDRIQCKRKRQKFCSEMSFDSLEFSEELSITSLNQQGINKYFVSFEDRKSLGEEIKYSFCDISSNKKRYENRCLTEQKEELKEDLNREWKDFNEEQGEEPKEIATEEQRETQVKENRKKLNEIQHLKLDKLKWICDLFVDMVKTGTFPVSFFIFDFDSFSKEIIYELLLKVFKIKDKKDKIKRVVFQRDKKDLDYFNSLIKLNRKKRTGEENQFIIKFIFESLRRDFFNSNNIDRKRPKTEEKFINHYFLAHSRKYKLDIRSFNDPLNSKDKAGYKTMNHEYMANLFKNTNFKKVFFEKINNNLKEDYFKTVEKKFRKMISPFIPFFESEYEDEEKKKKEFEAVLTQFKNIKTSKIPWFKDQVERAIENFIPLVNILVKESCVSTRKKMIRKEKNNRRKRK